MYPISKSSVNRAMQQISDHLYVFRDTCNVYIVRDPDQPDRAVLIDFGAGAALDELAALGIREVQAVLITHHHRDQVQGLPRAIASGIPIYAPYWEKHLIETVDQFWQARQLDNNYDQREDRFSLIAPIALTGTLDDYHTLRFGSLEFTVLPTPGHTIGSASLMAHIDGRLVVFSGDLIYAPGKVWSLTATQWSYNGAQGLPASYLSLHDLKARGAELLLPSHGAPIPEPAAAMDLTARRLNALIRQRRMLNLRLEALHGLPFEAVTPHLLWNRTCEANSYVLRSESGKALIFDYGYDFCITTPEAKDRHSRRPWLYNIPALKTQFGVTQIEAVIATHYHDDHVAGFNLLRQFEGAEVWAGENFAHVLEYPTRYDLPCLWFEPIPVDRRLPLGTPIQWEEYTLTVHPLPGHTLYATAIEVEVDGTRALISGDQHTEGTNYNYVYHNRFALGDYVRSARLYREVAPNVILSGHVPPLWITPEIADSYYAELAERGAALDDLHRDLLPLDEPGLNFGAGSQVAWMEPYQAEARAGEMLPMTVWVVNPGGADCASATLAVPEGWRVLPEEQNAAFTDDTACLVFGVVPPEGLQARRVPIAADVTIDGRRFGQVAEALVTVR